MLAVVLLSGGLDSAVCLAFARSLGYDCHALSLDYGQRHRAELAAAEHIAHALGALLHKVVRIDLRSIGGSALTADIDVPKSTPPGHPLGQDEGSLHTRFPGDATIATRSNPANGLRASLGPSIPVTYVPARNLIFLSIAAAYAETVGARDIFIGVNAIDYSGYPDCRPEFIDSFQKTVNLATRAGVEGASCRVRTPLSGLGKADIIRLGASLGIDFSLTTSCYDPDADGSACGCCDACRLRASGFQDAGFPDPTRYATEIRDAQNLIQTVRTATGDHAKM